METEPCANADRDTRVIHLSTVSSIPAHNLPVESMQTVQQPVLGLFASADLIMKEILLSSAT